MKVWILLTGFCALTVSGQAYASTTSIALHPSEAPQLDRNQVKKIYLGKVRHLENGTRLTLTCLEKGVLHRDFLRQWVGMTPSQFRNHWRKRVFTGKSPMPRHFKSNAHQLNFVEKTPGAIGYRSASNQAAKYDGPSYFDPKTARYIKAKRS
ncbi:MAG: hypothetical protein HOI23_21745 [Deltaproteobacteria bacterium]|nr:hypothetical protein [Deltaproteobacteria bacterium]MBT6436127.1 hypothetical protein [Deltaproteobacteria bacterium]MBT6492622.1 hypothetical protein [Deltaproteobacteria bacterium]